MHTLGPAVNGTNAYGCRFATSSGRKRSGSNFNGFGQYLSDLCTHKIINTDDEPAGRMSPSKCAQVILILVATECIIRYN